MHDVDVGEELPSALLETLLDDTLKKAPENVAVTSAFILY
jgi:hypothetical protein